MIMQTTGQAITRQPLLSTARTFRQFAPNFTVYLLPPDVVCLYSEHRKFFLYGELYCALASAIGEGEWTIGELVRGLEPKFSGGQDPRSPDAAVRPRLCPAGLARLHRRRRRLLGKPRAVAAGRAGWSSDLPRPHSSDRRAGCKGVSAALSRLGVRVVQRSPDLTIVLVRDYLDGRLAELNRQHLADRTPWLLVQPSGVFPLVGPVFVPRESACWTCLSDRMRRNREIRGMLDRSGACVVSVSPLARQPFGQNRNPACRRRNCKGDRHRLCDGLERSHHQPRSAGRGHREALRGGAAAMSELRPQETARSAPGPGADRARRRWQAGHDQRRIPDRFAARHGGAFPQARQPAHRRGFGTRTDRSRRADEHQLPRGA